MKVRECHIKRDYRFTLEDQYLDLLNGLQPGVTPLTVLDFEMGIIGWLLHGWKPPPPIILYSSDWWGMEW
jgi:hypothetical protein